MAGRGRGHRLSRDTRLHQERRAPEAALPAHLPGSAHHDEVDVLTDSVAKHYLPAIEDREPADLYLITLDARPIGFIQTYLVSDYPAWEAVVQAGAGVAGVDLFIAEAELTGRGLGTAVLRRFVREIVFSALSTSACVADPDAANAASIRAFEKAGFRRVRDFLDPGDGKTHTLMRLDRDNNGR